MTGGNSRGDTIMALAGARAFPPLMIVLFHFSEGHHYSGVHWLDLIATRGYLWVEFFFVLSGFILTHVYWDRLGDLWKPSGYGAFLKARLIRLYPLHLFMLLLLLAMVVGLRVLGHWGGYRSIFDARYHQDISVRGFIASLLLVHAWDTMKTLTWNGASWFVSAEFALCLMFPAVLWLARGRTWRGVALIAAGLGGLSALLATSAHGLDITYDRGVLRGLSEFSIGAGMAVLFRWLKPRDRLPAHGHSLLQLAILILLAWATQRTGWSHTSRDICTVLPLMAMVFALAFDRGIVAEALKTRLPQMMGEWSYAVYLGQTTWLLAIRFFEQRLYPPPDAIVLGMRFSTLIWWLEPVALVSVCFAWGAFLAEKIEIPAAAALRRWIGPKKGSALDRPAALTPS